MIEQANQAFLAQMVMVGVMIFWCLLWAFASAALGNRTGRWWMGFFWGLLLGPIGVIVTACVVFGAPAAPADVPETESEGWEMPRHEGPRRRIIIRKRQ